MRMFAMINETTLRQPVDAELRREMEQRLFPRLRAIAGLHTYYLVRAEGTKVIAVGIYNSAEAMEGALMQIAEIWQSTNMMEYMLTLPVVNMGEVIAHW